MSAFTRTIVARWSRVFHATGVSRTRDGIGLRATETVSVIQMKQLRILLVAIFFAVTLGAAFGQAAGNDVFANRYVITGNPISTNGTTVGGSIESGEPAPFGNNGPSVWYEWTAPISSSVTIGISGNYREILGIYTG